MDILSLGTENKTSFSVLRDNKLYTSRVYKDLRDINTFNAYRDGILRYLKENNIRPDYIVKDLHPDHVNNSLAKELNNIFKGSRLIDMQHHHAHIVSCMYDNALDEETIGIVFDGTGYGDDGLSWGGEIFKASRIGYKRLYHLKYMPLIGNDKAAEEVYRMGISYLYDTYNDDIYDIDLPIIRKTGKRKIGLFIKMIRSNINSPKVSSMGRLFDAVSSILGLVYISKKEGEGAILLEGIAEKDIIDSYGYSLEGDSIVFSDMIHEITDDIVNRVEKGIISAKFHNTIVDMVYDIASNISKNEDIRKVLITGGCFQNRYLLDHIEKRFIGSGMILYKHKDYSASDTSISIGQAVSALSCIKDR